MEKTQIDVIKEEAQIAREKELLNRRTVDVMVYNQKTRKMEKQRIGVATKPFKRIFLIATLFLIEIAFLILLLVYYLIGSIWVMSIFYGIGIIFAIRVAVSTTKNYDSKIAWILFLLILAPIAIIIYFLAGESTTTPLKSRKLKKIDAKTKFLARTELPENLSPRIRQDCTFIQNTSDYIPYFGGSGEYFPMGEDFFEDVLTKLKKAQKFIFMDFFILSSGKLADAIFTILVQKVRAGVDVRIIVDGLGSHGMLSYSKVRKIRKYGIKILAFEPIVPIFSFLMNYRNHHKIIVIDGVTGYVGGANIADEYVNAKVRYGAWKDAGMRIDGAAVRSLTLTFLRMWEYSSREKPDYQVYLDASPAINDDNQENMEDGATSTDIVLPYAGGPEEKNKLCKDVYNNMIENAAKKLYIMTPYFIVDLHMIAMLANKARSGVDVRLIIPGIPDKKFAYSLTKANAQMLVGTGAKVYIYTPGFLHSKVIMSDDECAVVGSVNLDFRSFYQQYENAAYITGEGIIKQISDDFENTFAHSSEVTTVKKRNVFVRMWVTFLRLFAPLM